MAPAMAQIDADPEIRVAVLRGRGRAFTAGLDLPAMIPKLPLSASGPDGARQQALHQMIRDMQAAVTCFERSRVPVIAAVHGHCVGGGVDIITACDIRLASADATFSVRETKLAMVADLGTLQRLPRIVGPGAARELVFTGRDIDAAHAARIGLVERVLPDPESVFAAARELATQIAENPPLAVQGAKRVMNEAVVRDVDQGLEFVSTWNAAHLLTRDLAAAASAFATGKKPEFSGR
jgi:enoyl-CoA hydratase